jgi:tetratricopeptide (TPR) repeat protein
VSRLFNEAAQLSPEDADVHIVLGVLYNLSREYDKAIGAFETALKLKPQDYSLWNKLGATQANSIQSADAIMAYQQVHFPVLFAYSLLHSRILGLNYESLSSSPTPQQQKKSKTPKKGIILTIIE